jgi:hypothetical protein
MHGTSGYIYSLSLASRGSAVGEFDMRRPVRSPVSQSKTATFLLVALGHSRSGLRGEVLAQPVHTPESWDLALRIAKGVPDLVGELILQSCRSSRVLHCLRDSRVIQFSGTASFDSCSDVDALATHEDTLRCIAHICRHGRRAW